MVVSSDKDPAPGDTESPDENPTETVSLKDFKTDMEQIDAGNSPVREMLDKANFSIENDPPDRSKKRGH